MAIDPKINLELKNKKEVKGIVIPTEGADSKPVIEEKKTSASDYNAVHENQTTKTQTKNNIIQFKITILSLYTI